MQEMASRSDDLEFVIVTTVPKWFFEQCLGNSFIYYSLQTDVGMVQRTSLQVDFDATVAALDSFYPLSTELVERTGALFRGCSLVLCDVAPLGILAARHLGIRSILVENFTWDWIYGQYLARENRLEKHIRYLAGVYGLADYRIQTEPCCNPLEKDLRTAPVVRRSLGTAEEIRRRFVGNKGEKLILVTMGGGDVGPVSLEAAAGLSEYQFVFPGMTGGTTSHANLHFLPRASTLYHPDLVAAADLVVGKVGYSTLAEVYQAGSMYGYVKRPGFPETPTLERFIVENIPSFEILEAELGNGSWVDKISRITLSGRGRKTTFPPSGAKEITDFLFSIA